MTASISYKARYADVPTSAIEPNPDQPRKHFDPVALRELADSIQASGLLEPIILRSARPEGSQLDVSLGERFIIIAGERRWRASQMAGLLFMPARILSGLDEDEAYILSVLENVSRVDMTPMEEVNAYAKLVEMGNTPAEVAAMFGKTTDYVTWRMGLLGLNDAHRKLIDSGTISTTLGYYIAKLSPVGQDAVVRKAMRGGFATDSDGVAFAQAVYTGEQHEFILEVQEMVEQQTRRREAPALVSDEPPRVDQVIERFAQSTADLLELFPTAAKPRELAKQHGLDASTYLEWLLPLTEAAITARRQLRKAVAIVEVAQERAGS